MRRKLLILSGPTHEYIDPVRFISNASSGLMGKAIAEEAVAQGFEITFISGPVAPTALPDLGYLGSIINVINAEEMLSAAQEPFQDADIAIFAAAVADYTPTEQKTEKMAKSEKDLALHLKATADIAKTLSSSKTEQQITIGFALQTIDGEKIARQKLESKKFNGIVLNTPATLGSDSGTFSYLSVETSAFEHWGTINKVTCAKNILDQVS